MHISRQLILATLLYLFHVSHAPSAVAQPKPGTAGWVQDTPHCKAIFRVGHDNSIATVTGWFSRMVCMLNFDGKNLKDASVTAKISVSSLATGSDARDQHLLSQHFLDQEQFPYIKFKSTAIKPGAAGRFKMTGDLEIKGKKKSVTLDCTGPRGPVKGDNEKTRIGFNATTHLNRKDFDVSWNRIVSPGVTMVADDAEITLEMEFIKVEK